MPNGKTHFMIGAIVGAAVNFTIQSAQMAMDYDRQFDWGEFFLCAGAGAFAGGRDAFHRVRNPRQFFHSIISAILIAYAISGNHTLKLSRTTRLYLWAFGINYLSHIALDCTTPRRINLL